MSGKIRIVSDCYNKYKNDYGYFGEDVIPVDMNGRRITEGKSDSNLQNIAEDIQDYYGLKGDKGFV